MKSRGKTFQFLNWKIRQFVYVFSIHATCFHPDALQLIVGAGDKVLVYDASDGNLIETLKGRRRIFFKLNQ